MGEYQGEGASWQLTAWKNCADSDQRHPGAGTLPPGAPGETNPGTVVVDVSSFDAPGPRRPGSPALGDDRPLGIAEGEPVPGNCSEAASGRSTHSRRPMDSPVYDITTDCKAPVLKSDVHLPPGSFGHSGQWAPDGKTFYITPLRATPSLIVAVNVDDPTARAILCAVSRGGYLLPSTCTDGGTPGPQDLPLSTLHDLEFSKDGNTAYITMFGVGGALVPLTAAQNGFAVLDVSDFQQRRPDAGYRVVGRLTWDHGSIGAQNALPVTIAGKPYIVMADEAGGAIFGFCMQEDQDGFRALNPHLHPATPHCRRSGWGRRTAQCGWRPLR